jgi:hypothetical protein
MSRDEWRWRAREALHVLGERIGVATGTARWNRQNLGEILADPVRDRCAREIERGDWVGAQRLLTAQIAARGARFVLNPSSAAALRACVNTHWPAAAENASRRADALLQGRYNLLGYRDVTCASGGRIDWHTDPVHGRTAPLAFYTDVPFLDPEIGDHKVIWELNRHQHWLQLGRAAWLSGDPGYGRAITAQLSSWLAANPPFIGVNWASMLEIAFRSIAWTWALHCLLGHRAVAEQQEVGSEHSTWLVDLLIGLDQQLTHIERHLSYYFSPNTHLTGEGLALYVVGTALPELAASRRWTDTGRAVLLNEIDRQILRDGGHVERSAHYQRYTLDFYLLATLTARLSGDAAAARFEEAAHRLADFTDALAGSDGRLPLIGDDDGGMLWPIAGRDCDDVRDSLALAAAVLNRPALARWGMHEEVAWIAGADAIRPLASSTARYASRLLPDTGYFVSRQADGSHAVFDVGLHGYQNAGHAHADALSLTLSLDGRSLLIDPGTSTYTMDSQLRDRLRSTAAHNTVTVDGRSQSVPAGPFHWRSTADARVVACRINDAFDWIEAEHRGYAPTRHRRTIVRTVDSGWLIVDTIDHDPHRHSAAAHWHFDPAWRVTADANRVHATHQDGDTAWMLCSGGDVSLARGDAEHGAGWCAPIYGQLTPTWTVTLAAEANAPFTLVTWIGSGRIFASPHLRCQRLAQPDDDAVIVEIVDGARTAVFMVRPARSVRPRRACRAGEFETDAAMLHYVTEGERLRSLSVVDGQHVVTAREQWISTAAAAAMSDLHIAMRGRDIDFLASEPPQHLIVQGITEYTAARINGRDLPLSSKSPTDTLLIHGRDWLPFSTGKPAPSLVAKGGAGFARQ